MLQNQSKIYRRILKKPLLIRSFKSYWYIEIAQKKSLSLVSAFERIACKIAMKWWQYSKNFVNDLNKWILMFTREKGREREKKYVKFQQFFEKIFFFDDMKKSSIATQIRWVFLWSMKTNHSKCWFDFSWKPQSR